VVTGRLEAINISGGGVPKTPVFEALVTKHGLDGDRQNLALQHGGLDRAVVLYSLDMIEALQIEGHPIATGSVGENLTVSGLDWRAIVPGTRLTIGEVELHITRYVTPCNNIRGYFLDHDFLRIFQDRHPGWSRVCAKVVREGIVRPGDLISVDSVHAV
jgi:MOSC domain-containing protein YiiM